MSAKTITKERHKQNLGYINKNEIIISQKRRKFKLNKKSILKFKNKQTTHNNIA